MQHGLTITAAPGEPFISVTGHGLWTAEQFDRHFRALDRELRAMRARSGIARVLVDLSQALVQTAEATAVMNRWTARIYQPCDQVAVICASTLQTLQVRRESRTYQRIFFPDRKAAVAWLLSDKQAGAATAGTRSA